MPHLLEVNSPLVEEASRYRSLQNRDGALECFRRLLRESSALLAVSGPLATLLHSSGAPGDRIHVVPTAVDGELFERHVPPSSP